MPTPKNQPSIPFLRAQCNRLNLPSKGTRAELMARISNNKHPHPRSKRSFLDEIQEGVAELKGALDHSPSASSSEHPSDREDDTDLDVEIESVIHIMHLPDVFKSSSSALARFLTVASPRISNAFRQHHLFPIPIPDSSHSKFGKKFRALEKNLKTLHSNPSKFNPPARTKGTPSSHHHANSPTHSDSGSDSNLTVPTPTKSESQDPAVPDQYTVPGPDALVWTCEVDPVQYGGIIRQAISFLDKKSSRCGHKTMVKAVAAEQAHLAELISDDVNFESAKTKFVAHVIDLLEFAAARALRKGDHSLHNIRLRHKADFVQAFDDLSTSISDPFKAEPTRKFLKVIILAALGRLFSPAQTAAFKRMGINLPPSFFGLAPQSQSLVVSGHTPVAYSNPTHQRNQFPPHTTQGNYNTPNTNISNPPRRTRARILGSHTPNAAEIIGFSTPGAVNKTDSNCETCNSKTHDGFECYQAWWNTYKRPMPGFVNQGGKWIKDPAMWNGNDASPALGALWLGVQKGGKCRESPYGQFSKRAPPDFQSIANHNQNA